MTLIRTFSKRQAKEQQEEDDEAFVLDILHVPLPFVSSLLFATVIVLRRIYILAASL